METTTISGRPNATLPLTGSERLVMDQGTQTVDASAADVAALAPPTNLGYTPETRTLTSSTGDGVPLPLAAPSADGLMPAASQARIEQLGADDSPTFAGLTITGTAAVVIPHIHGAIAGPSYIHIKNTGSTTLPKGTPVYTTGAVGDTETLEVQKADSANPLKMPAVGLLDVDVAPNGFGHAIVVGELTGQNTSGYGINAPLYVAAGGGTTAVRPTTGIIQQVAIVGRSNATTGSLTATIGPQLDPNWDAAYSERLRWDGGATGLNAATARTSLGLGTAATTDSTAYDAAGAATAAVAGHAAALDPHPQYLTSAEGNAAYAATNDARFHDAVTLDASVADLLSLAGQLLSADSPGSDKLWFWDHSAGKATHLTTDSALLIDGTTLRALSTVVIPLTAEAANLTQATLLTIPYWPEARVLTALPLWMLNTAATGSAAQFDIRVGGTSIFATLPTIDATEASTATAATAAVFSTAFISGGQQIAQGASVTFHCTQIGATVAGAGLKVALPSRRAS
jgi:hypothetical protein